jgi:hypothetical protein
MADHIYAIRVTPCHQSHIRIPLDQMGQINQLTVNAPCEGSLGQPWANRRSDFQ